MHRTLALALVLIALGRLASAAPAPFGGDDAGFVPKTPDALKTESKALLLGAKVSYKIVVCHIDLASKALKGEGIGNSEDACENSLTSKLNGQLNKLCVQGTCPACLQVTNATLGADVEAARDADNGDVFCAGTTPFGDDDTGVVPPDATTFKCEASAAKNLAKLRLCIAKCHIKMAKFAFKAVAFDDDACESTDPLRSCRAKYNALRDRIVSLCAPCLDAATQNMLADTAEADADTSLGSFYCASPSGAFVE
jgi:hypothetical protein